MITRGTLETLSGKFWKVGEYVFAARNLGRGIVAMLNLEGCKWSSNFQGCLAEREGKYLGRVCGSKPKVNDY